MTEKPDPIRVHDGSVRMARELLTLKLAGEQDMLAERIHYLCTFPLTFCPSVILALVQGLAATWDSLEDFSAHVMAADLREMDADDD